MKKLAKKLAAALAAFAVVGCLPEAKGEAEAAQIVAVCVARIRTECKPTADGKKDTACPAYVECKDALDAWENEP